MRFRFRGLPGPTDVTPRPLLPIRIEGLNATALECLVDTGSIGNRMPAWVAAEAGISLIDVPIVALGIGGQNILSQTVPVALSLRDYSWTAPMTFCDPWPWSFGLLGQEGFFRWFQVTITAADRHLEVGPYVSPGPESAPRSSG